MRRSLFAPAIGVFAATAVLADEPIECGPYVQAVTESTAAVLWEGEEADRLTLELEGERVTARIDVACDSVLVDSKWRRRCEATLHRLAPGERIEAALTAPDGSLVDGSRIDFRAAPRSGSSVALFFADSGTGGSSQKRIARLMEGMAADFILHGGDVVYPSGARKDYDDHFFEVYGDLLRRAPFYPVLGNHDIRTDDGAPYLDVFRFPETGAPVSPAHRGRYYAFRWGELYVIALDSNVKVKRVNIGCEDEETVSDDNRYRTISGTWLEDEMSAESIWFRRTLSAAPEDCWIAVLLHHAPLSSSYHGANCGLVEAFGRAEIETGRKIDLVLSGHEHDYQRSWPIDLTDRDDRFAPASRKRREGGTGYPTRFHRDEGTLFVVSGGGGGNQRFRPSPDLSAPWIARGDKTHEFTQILFDSRQIVIQAFDDSGELIDQVRLVR